VTVIFYGNAYKNYAKNSFYYDGFQYLGGWEYNQLDDGGGWTDNNDQGVKTDWTDTSSYHFRVYAANDYRMYNSAWNYYVAATTHRDRILNGGYGWSEDCENYLCSLAQQKAGWTVTQDSAYFYNPDWPGRWDGNQYWQCDGWASLIAMP
jgi:hypothetical protein